MLNKQHVCLFLMFLIDDLATCLRPAIEPIFRMPTE